MASGSVCATLSDCASISSTAAKPAATRSGSAAVASRRVGKMARAEAAWGATGMVRKVAEATNPRVPSEPIIRCLAISRGVSKSSRELIP